MNLRFYQVNAWQEKDETVRYGRHLCIGVVAEDAVTALSRAQHLHPKARMDSVNDRGIVHDIVGSVLTQPGEST